MASTSNTRTRPQLEDPAPSTSASARSPMPAFVMYEPPTNKIPFQSDKRYHVFLSFRGPDVRKTLVDHLYQALSTAGLNVFLDSERLEKGDILGLSLEAAIESSAIRIPIFSRGYADSSWCLKEAAAMLKTPALIIPLFYHVDPTHVRYPENESSPYKQSFLKHYRHSDRYPREVIKWWKHAVQQICPCLNLYGRSVRYKNEEIDGWKNALQEICSRSGWFTDKTEGFEAWLVKAVVNDLLKTFDRVPLEVAKHPVGMDTLKNALIHKLNLNSLTEVVKVGIWGIGGIGKTTVAKALYNHVYADFDAACFVYSVRATAADHTGLIKLQKQILKDLSSYGGEVDNVDKGISLLRDRLKSKRVLLILDDVDAVKQLDALVGDWLSPGSRLIIISRDKYILHRAGISSACIQELSGLDIFESLQLFSWHAFLKASPSPNYEDLSIRIVEACKGHPLSLEMIGSFLYDKQNDTDCWMEALGNITRYPEIQERLYISYGALNDEEKEIFMDIACFFIGKKKSFPIAFWQSLYKKVYSALSNLSMKSLIKIDDEGVFGMHDHLRDMGRSIAEKEKEDIRLWEADRLSTISNNINVSRLRLSGGNAHGLQLLCRPGLKYLDLHNLFVEGMIEDLLAMLPSTLIWLGLEDCTFSIKKPRHSRFVVDFPRLKIMQLKFCQGVDSLSISSQFSLQYLELRGCENLSNLSDTIDNLSHLRYLDLGACENLNNLSNTIGNLLQLNYLNLRGCASLNNLPETIGNLLELQHLDLKGCNSLNTLPDTFGNLSQLQHLDLDGCANLKHLPDSIGNLSQLQHLDLKGCRSLNNLPDSIDNLSQLQHLNFEGCATLNDLSDGIGNLSQLQHLDLSKCISLNNLPDSIGNLSQLQHFDLEGCATLSNLPDSIGNLLQLLHLDLKGCAALNNLPDSIGNLYQLQHLDLKGCATLNNLPDSIGNLYHLQHLDLNECKSLNSLPDNIGNLSLLQHLNLEGCATLNNLPDTIGFLSQLQHLNLNGCRNLNNLPDSIGNLTQLQLLDLKGCNGLNNLPDSFGNLWQLQHLDLDGCANLKQLPDSIGNLSQLEHLDLKGCGSLNNLPDSIGNLLQLQHLDLKGCATLNNLPDSIGNLSQLQHLDLEGCATLNNLPDSIGNLSQLQILNLKGCISLNILPDSIENLSQLEYFDFENFPQTNWQPEFGKVWHVKKNLTDIIGNLGLA